MLSVIHRARTEYPSQFWLVFWGMLISAVGGSMIWPFLMVYVSERLQLPMTATASLMTLSAVTGLIASFIAGPIVDRFGRKWIMVISLVLNALGYVFMSQAQTLSEFAILMAINGIVNPLYRIGLDSMIADLIPANKRADAYSLTRMANNIAWRSVLPPEGSSPPSRMQLPSILPPGGWLFLACSSRCLPSRRSLRTMQRTPFRPRNNLAGMVPSCAIRRSWALSFPSRW